MRVYATLDAIQDRSGAERGVPRYSLEFALAMEKAAPGTVERWLLREGEPVPPTAVDLLETGRLAYGSDRSLTAPDIVHSLAPFQYVTRGVRIDDVFPARLRGPRTRFVSTLYDLIPLIYSDIYLQDHGVLADYLLCLELVRASDLVLAISDATARDAVRLLGIPPSKVKTIGTGVPDSVTDPDVPGSQRLIQSVLPAVQPGFLLTVGGLDFRKNLDGLMEGYSRLSADVKAEHQLVIVCKLSREGREQLQGIAVRLGILDRVVFTDLVSDETLRALYTTTDLFVFASLYEGFGLPVVEALRAGAPVVVGDNSSLREIVPIADARFDAADPADIARVIAATLSCEERRTRTLREVDHAHHSWENVAEATLDAYRLLGPRSSTPSVRRPRLAFVTPTPPVPSGISEYSMRLIAELRKAVDIDVFTAIEAAADGRDGVEFHPYGGFDQLYSEREYDHLLIAVGNSEYHVDAFEILRRYGGTVMLHDVRVTGLLGVVADLRVDLLDSKTLEDIRTVRRGELPDGLLPYPSFSASRAQQTNGLLPRAVVEAADRVLVHSRSALSVIELEVPRSERSKVDVIPFGFPMRAPSHVRRDAITSFGFLNVTKQCEIVCEAFILAAHRLPDAVFAFVGRADLPEFDARLRSMISSAGLEDRIRITGRVSDEEYGAWIDRSMLSVQLRTQFNGESSAAAAETIGAGVPTMVSALGWMAELPDEVAPKVALSVTAAELAGQIVALASDPMALRAIAERGTVYAEQNSFANAAASVLAALRAPNI